MRKTSKPSQYYYLIMNKPCGYVCSAASDSHKTVYELLTPELQELVSGAPRGCRLHTVGRLDCDTSGLLLLTNDGKFSNRITASTVVVPESPVVEALETYYNSKSVKENCEDMEQFSRIYHHVSKTYRAHLKNPVTPENQKEYINRAAAGLTLPPEKKYGEQQAEPAALHFIKPDLCEITIHEGKFHEVRRIFRALGNEVKDLERISIGSLQLPKELTPGQWRELTANELELFMLF